MKDKSRQIQNNGADGAPEAQLSAIRGVQRLPAPTVGPEAVNITARPGPLVGARIPSRNQHTRDLVVRLYEENLHLQRADLLAITRYAELSWKFRRLAELQEKMGDVSGYLKADLEPRRILAELRQMADSLLRHEAALALVPSARVALGVDVGRMRKLAQSGGDQDDNTSAVDVEALEQRIVRRLAEGRQTPPDGREQEEGDDG